MGFGAVNIELIDNVPLHFLYQLFVSLWFGDCQFQDRGKTFCRWSLLRVITAGVVTVCDVFTDGVIEDFVTLLLSWPKLL